MHITRLFFIIANIKYIDMIFVPNDDFLSGVNLLILLFQIKRKQKYFKMTHAPLTSPRWLSLLHMNKFMSSFCASGTFEVSS